MDLKTPPAPPFVAGSRRADISSQYPQYLDGAIETMARPDIERLQEARLGPLLDYAYKNAPLIRKMWDEAGVTPRDIRSLPDFFAKAPFLTKDIIRDYREANNDQTGGLFSAAWEDLRALGSSSGTSGDPTPVPRGKPGTPDVSEEGYLRDVWEIGARPGDYMAQVLFTFRAGHRARGLQQIGITPIILGVAPHEMPNLCKASLEFRPTVLRLLSNPLLIALEKLFEDTGQDPYEVFKSYRGAKFGGEALGARMKALGESWGIEFFETTSLGDCGGSTECRMHDGMHAWEDQAIVECLDPVTQEPVPDGEVGELVVTTLVDRYNPLIRNRTEDLVTLNREPCLCGRTHLRLKLRGRAGDQIIVNGRTIMPRDVMTVIEGYSESRAGLFQLIRPSRELSELAVRIGYDPTRLTSTTEDLAKRITDHLLQEFEVPVRVELTPDAQLLKLGPPHKIPRVTKQ